MNNIALNLEPMVKKWQKYIALGVMVLVAIMIVGKVIANRQVWEEGDRENMINGCLEDLAGRSVRFPKQSQEYCECSTDAMMENFSKSKYHEALNKSEAEKKQEMLPVILECYNTYQDAMFEASK
jgi:hypothetical protein